MYIVAILKFMDPNKSLVNLFCKFVLQMNFVSDNIILIFSPLDMNIIIYTNITSNYSLHISNQTKLINCSKKKNK